ncbi:MAG TPA: hypothetical protein VMT52_19920 [Planctomycetota bacterium]|nr:hypothetical protein [Planctomycetota bacterium]
MSMLAKVFVVFILILSVVFFGTSATLFVTRTDWREAYNRYVTEANKELDTLKSTNSRIAGLYNTESTKVIQLKASEDQLGKELKQTKEDLSEVRKKSEIANNNAKAANDVSQQLTETLKAKDLAYQQIQEQLAKSRGELDAARTLASDALKSRDSMRLDLEKTNEELHVARATYKELADNFDSLEINMNAAMARYPELKKAGPAARPIDGLVTAVKPDANLVVLSIGREQKVETGYEFTISRGEKFIGKVKVLKVFPDLSGAEVLYTKEGEEIQQGDKATTSI